MGKFLTNVSSVSFSPILTWFFTIFTGLLFLPGLMFANSLDQNMDQDKKKASENKNLLLGFYQEHISAVDGNRCAMYPSCSQYASNAVQKHGLIPGWIMACDRLVRCGRDEADISVNIIIKNRKLIYDPVEANDFWWFEKEKKQ